MTAGLVSLLVVSACGGGSGATPAPPETQPLASEDGTVDPEQLQTIVADATELSPDEQESSLATLDLELELAVAEWSGLTEALGGEAATREALIAHGAAYAAIGRAAAEGPTGFRSPRATADTSLTGPMFGGYLEAALGGTGVVTSTNDLEEGAPPLGPVTENGITRDGSIERAHLRGEHEWHEHGVDSELTTDVVVMPCPDTDGEYTAEVVLEMAVTTGGGATGQRARVDLALTGYVDDDAMPAGQDIELEVEWADFTNRKGSFTEFTFTRDRDDRSDVSLTDRQVGDAGTLSMTAVRWSTLLATSITRYLVDAASSAWRSGRCVRLDVSAAPGPSGLEPASTATVSAEPRSKVDGQPTGGTVTATLSAGGASVEPDGSPLPADAAIVYRAPDEPGTSGTVSLEARSKRGVGTASITLDTSAAYSYEVAGGKGSWSTVTQVCDIRQPFTLTGSGFEWSFSGGLTGGLTFTGPFNTQGAGTYTISLPDGPGKPGTLTSVESGTTLGEGGAGTITYTMTPINC